MCRKLLLFLCCFIVIKTFSSGLTQSEDNDNKLKLKHVIEKTVSEIYAIQSLIQMEQSSRDFNKRVKNELLPSLFFSNEEDEIARHDLEQKLDSNIKRSKTNLKLLKTTGKELERNLALLIR